MTRSCKSETWQHLFLSIKVSLGLSRVWQRMCPHRPLVADPLERLAATLSLWQRLSFLSEHSFYAQRLLFFKIKDIFPSVHVFSNSQIKFMSLNIHSVT